MKRGSPRETKRPISCLFLSDIHYGQIIEIGNHRTFDPEICKKMFNRIVENLNFYRDEDDEVLYIFLLGDMVEGNSNYKEQISESIEVTRQLSEITGILIGFVFDLMESYKEIKIIGVIGNHGRIDRRRDITKENWDRIVYNQLQLAFKNQPEVDVIVCEDFIQRVQVGDHIFIISHGDHTRCWGGIPFYGLRRDISKFFLDLGKFDTMVLGHFHTFAELFINGVHLIMNGCFPPSNPFSKRVIKTHPIQVQLFLKVLGHDIIETRKIWLNTGNNESEILRL